MDIGYRFELQEDRMPGETEAVAFTDSYKHMECLGGMMLQSILNLFTRATPGTLASKEKQRNNLTLVDTL